MYAVRNGIGAGRQLRVGLIGGVLLWLGRPPETLSGASLDNERRPSTLIQALSLI